MCMRDPAWRARRVQGALEVIFNQIKFRVVFLQAMLIWSERGRGSKDTYNVWSSMNTEGPKGGGGQE